MNNEQETSAVSPTPAPSPAPDTVETTSTNTTTTTATTVTTDSSTPTPETQPSVATTPLSELKSIEAKVEDVKTDITDVVKDATTETTKVDEKVQKDVTSMIASKKELLVHIDSALEAHKSIKPKIEAELELLEKEAGSFIKKEEEKFDSLLDRVKDYL